MNNVAISDTDNRKSQGIVLRPAKEPVMRQKPTVLAREIVASSRLFRVEELQLRFANGVERTYERLVGRGNGYGAVMIVAMIDADHAVLVEEYCGGTDEYELSLPKGLIEPGAQGRSRVWRPPAGTPDRTVVVARLHEPEDPGGAGHGPLRRKLAGR